jgi:hypothetical protein
MMAMHFCSRNAGETTKSILLELLSLWSPSYMHQQRNDTAVLLGGAAAKLASGCSFWTIELFPGLLFPRPWVLIPYYLR